MSNGANGHFELSPPLVLRWRVRVGDLLHPANRSDACHGSNTPFPTLPRRTKGRGNRIPSNLPYFAIKSAGAIVAIMALFCVGCKAKPKAIGPTTRPHVTQPIAIVDVNQIVKAMGWDREMKHAMGLADRQFRVDLNHQLLDLSQQASQVRSTVAKEAHFNEADTLRLQNVRSLSDLYALPLTMDQRETLMAAGIQTNLAMAEARQDYRKQLRKRQLELMASYRNVVIPVAERVAAREGFRIVMTLDTTIVYYDPATDVSQQIIDEMKSARPSWEQNE
jgi:Skp family chaperone for outer membrane proteins